MTGATGPGPGTGGATGGGPGGGMVAESVPRPRLAGVDAARALALFGMALAHLHATTAPDGTATPVGAVVSGRASALFAVLAGVGVALSTRWVRDRRDHAGAAAGLVVRGVLLGVLGAALVSLPGERPAVILTQYGLLFVVAAALLRVRAGPLLVAAGVWGVGSPVLSHVLRAGRPAGPGEQPGLGMLAAPGELFTTLALTGYYPVLTWITYLLVGLGVGRLDLRSARVARLLVLVGALLAVAALAASALLLGPLQAGPGGVAEVALSTQRAGTTPPGDPRWLLVDARHSGTPFDLAHTAGTSLAVLGAVLLLARVARGPVRLLAATGTASLTLYTAHIVLAGLVGPFGTAAWALQVLVALGFGAVLLVTRRRRGPLEALVGGAARAVRHAVAGRWRAGGEAGAETNRR